MRTFWGFYPADWRGKRGRPVTDLKRKVGHWRASIGAGLAILANPFTLILRIYSSRYTVYMAPVPCSSAISRVERKRPVRLARLANAAPVLAFRAADVAPTWQPLPPNHSATTYYVEFYSNQANPDSNITTLYRGQKQPSQGQKVPFQDGIFKPRQPSHSVRRLIFMSNPLNVLTQTRVRRRATDMKLTITRATRLSIRVDIFRTEEPA